MSLKNYVKDYLTFGKRDRIGILFLTCIGIIIYIFPLIFSRPNNPFPLKERAVLIKAVDTLEARNKTNDTETAEGYQYQPTETKSLTKGALFEFDPNTLSIEGWQKLGLKERTAKTINNYRTKGGKFYKPEDLKKIWGLPEGFYERVKDYISIASLQKEYTPHNYEKQAFEKSAKIFALIDINSADTTALIALPGIGNKLALRIINFRDKLGGFYSVDQIGETYGLQDSIFQKIKSRLRLDGENKKFNVNEATKDELKSHPYIRWNLANSIVEYRNQHGNFKSLEDLKNIALIDEATFNKIVHYLTL